MPPAQPVNDEQQLLLVSLRETEVVTKGRNGFGARSCSLTWWPEVLMPGARIEANGYHVASLVELGGARAPLSALAGLHAEPYRQGHRWDPVRPLADEEAAELFLDPDELLPEAMYLALAGEHPVAVASLRRGDSAAQVDLGWTGALPAVATCEADVVIALVGRCLRQAAAASWHVLLDVDEADSRLWQLLDRLPVALEPDWLTFAELSRPRT